jgi:hypothetical protein
MGEKEMYRLKTQDMFGWLETDHEDYAEVRNIAIVLCRYGYAKKLTVTDLSTGKVVLHKPEAE